MTTLATVRTSIFDALSNTGLDVNVYRRRRTDYQYPVFVVAWPQSIDMRAAMGGERSFVIDVLVGVEVRDEDSADEQLEDLLEAAVTALMDESSSWDVQPVTDFGEEITGDARTILWCRLPVEVLD